MDKEVQFLSNPPLPPSGSGAIFFEKSQPGDVVWREGHKNGLKFGQVGRVVDGFWTAFPPLKSRLDRWFYYVFSVIWTSWTSFTIKVDGKKGKREKIKYRVNNRGKTVQPVQPVQTGYENQGMEAGR